MEYAAYLLWGLVGLVFGGGGFLIGFLNSKIKRAKMKRRTSGKNWGILRIKTKGGRIVEHIQNLDDPIYKMSDKMFSPNKTKARTVYYVDEVPVMYYDETDIRPIRLEDGTPTAMVQEPQIIDLDKAVPKRMLLNAGETQFEVNSDPTANLGAFMAYDQAKEAEFKLKQKKGDWEKFALAIAAIAAVVGAYLIYQQAGKFDELITGQAQILEAIKAIKPIQVV
jgi:hypothetical protein